MDVVVERSVVECETELVVRPGKGVHLDESIPMKRYPPSPVSRSVAILKVRSFSSGAGSASVSIRRWCFFIEGTCAFIEGTCAFIEETCA